MSLCLFCLSRIISFLNLFMREKVMVINVGSTDKKIRLIAGALVLALSFLILGGFNTTLGVVALIVGVVLLITGLVNFCPAYRLLGIGSTKKPDSSTE